MKKALKKAISSVAHKQTLDLSTLTSEEKYQVALKYLNRIACKFLKNKQDRDDLVMDNIEHWLKNSEKFNSLRGNEFKGLLYKTFYFKLTNKFRLQFLVIKGNKVRRNYESVSDLQDNLASLNLDNEVTLKIGSDNPELMLDTSIIMDYINSFNSKGATLFREHLEGFKDEELAEKYNTNYRTVKSNIAMFRSKVKTQFLN